MAENPGLAKFSWANLTPAFLDALSTRLRGLRVLEVFSGNGLMAHELAARGVEIRATSLFSGHDMHDRGFHHPVEELDAVAAVRRYGPESDALLMAWPSTTEAAAVAALEWGDDKPLLWIGEITLFDIGNAGLGGCATDFFHRITTVDADLPGYEPRGPLDRAVSLTLRPECLARWRQGARSIALIAPEIEEPVPFAGF